MTNIEIIEAIQPDGSTVDFVVIDNGNNEFTSMPKSVYDEQQAHLTESVTKAK